MRKRINYKNDDQIRRMRDFVITSMLEMHNRNENDDVIMDFYSEQITMDDMETSFMEDVIETYSSLTCPLEIEYEYNRYDCAEEMTYISKYYNYELA